MARAGKLWIVFAIVGAAVVGLGIGLAVAGTKSSPPRVDFAPIAIGPLDAFSNQVQVKGGGFVKITTTGPPMLVGFRRLSFPPGAVLGWHQHPGAAMVQVTQGEITEYNTSFPNCGPAIGKPGKVRWEPGNTTHTLLNRSKEETVIYVLSFDAPAYVKTPLIPEKRPASCPDVP